MNNCPRCGCSDIYVGAYEVECANTLCSLYSDKVELSTTRKNVDILVDDVLKRIESTEPAFYRLVFAKRSLPK